MSKSFREYCREENRLSVLAQWDDEKNTGSTPDSISYGSNKKVWWRCEQGHSWQASVKSRSGGAGCPVCMNKTVVPGVNDLAATHPELAAQWHPDKNGSLTPETVVAGTYRRVWWRCGKGHEWQAAIYPRAMGSGCPVCESKVILPGENDLASHAPEIAAQWNKEKNGTLKPQQVSEFSNLRVWWRCELGHEWEAAVSARTKNKSGCPYCTGKKVLPGFNDLQTLHPHIAKQWHPTLNGELKPSQITRGSRKRIWWQCEEGHVWQAVMYSRTTLQTGCPECAGKISRSKKLRYQRIQQESL